MTRKTPHKHQVKNHVRGGSRVKNYQRGKGRKPKVLGSIRQGKGGVKYNVQVFHSQGTEAYNVDGTTYAGALKAGLRHLQDRGAPYRVHLKRGG